MDIQAVIVSIEELNKTKNAIANAIRGKGVTSQGRFSNFVSEINSIKTDNAQSLVNNLSTQNVFRKKNDSEVEAVGHIKETFEIIHDNDVTIYSLYPIENIKIADGKYKDRVVQTPLSTSYTLDVDNNECGNVTYNTVRLSVQPIEARNINGEVVVKYTVNNQEKSITMVIKDIPKTTPDNVFILKQVPYALYFGDGNLSQTVNIKNTEDATITLYKHSGTVKTYKEKQEAFDTLAKLNQNGHVNAMFMISNNKGNTEYIPIEIYNIYTNTDINTIQDGSYSSLIDIYGTNVQFYCSSQAGVIDRHYMITTPEHNNIVASDYRITDKVKAAYRNTGSIIGIAIKADGSPITVEEAKAAGLN